MTVEARVVADSINDDGVRLTTLEVNMHRFVLAEFNTHRLFSRSSASSRAIPFAKQVSRVVADPAIPLVWATEQMGMQGGDPLVGDDAEAATDGWLAARDSAVVYAERLARLGVHKSIVNRLLEPFMWHRVIVSSTAWENFFRQRCSPLAQPEIHAAADAMRDAIRASAPQNLHVDQWHLPYVDDLTELMREGVGLGRVKAISVARCARVSYLTHDGVRDPQVDLDLYERLVTADPPHWAPLEHVATPSLDDDERITGNFEGWRQMRQDVEADRRILTKC